jgi:hypothetical protein
MSLLNNSVVNLQAEHSFALVFRFFDDESIVTHQDIYAVYFGDEELSPA